MGWLWLSKLVRPPPPQPISNLSVGDIVKVKESGKDVDYIVVNQGRPSSLYDESCNGTWLLRKDVYKNRPWHTSGDNYYSSSYINSYLNNSFINNFDGVVQSIIKQVKIPYVNGYGSGSGQYPVASGMNGLSVKIFLLSCYEVGWTSAYDGATPPADGSLLSYFGNHGRIAYKDGKVAGWWLRSAYVGNIRVYVVNDVGTGTVAIVSSGATSGVRPAFILPFDALVDSNGNIIT